MTFKQQVLDDASYRRLKSHQPSHKDIWKQHEELFIKVINKCKLDEEYIPEMLSTQGTDEDLLHRVFLSVVDIQWYQNIQAKGQKAYSNERKKVYDCQQFIQHYSDEIIKIDFPQHQNDTIRELEKNLQHKNSEIAIRLLKEHFGIKVVTATRASKIREKYKGFRKLFSNSSTK